MYIIIDIEFGLDIKYLPSPNHNDIVAISVIITDFVKLYQRKRATLDNIGDFQEDLENNIVLSYCYDFEASFLQKNNIRPRQYLDLNNLLVLGDLAFSCAVNRVFFNQNDICHTLVLLSMKNRDRIMKSINRKRLAPDVLESTKRKVPRKNCISASYIVLGTNSEKLAQYLQDPNCEVLVDEAHNIN